MKDKKCPKCGTNKLTVYFMNGHIKNDYICRDCGYGFGASYKNGKKVDLGLLDPKFDKYYE